MLEYSSYIIKNYTLHYISKLVKERVVVPLTHTDKKAISPFYILSAELSKATKETSQVKRASDDKNWSLLNSFCSCVHAFSNEGES